jgi:hypothetical protein
VRPNRSAQPAKLCLSRPRIDVERFNFLTVGVKLRYDFDPQHAKPCYQKSHFVISLLEALFARRLGLFFTARRTQPLQHAASAIDKDRLAGNEAAVV